MRIVKTSGCCVTFVPFKIYNAGDSPSFVYDTKRITANHFKIEFITCTSRVYNETRFDLNANFVHFKQVAEK